MDTPQFPDNSKYSTPGKDAKKKEIKPVVLTPVHTQKRPLGKRLKEMFVGGDARSAWGGVLVDVLLPAAKDTILDAVTQGAERMLFGEARGGYRRPGGSRGGVVHTAYNRMYGGSVTPMPRETAGPRTAANAPRGTRSSSDFGEIVMGSRAEAQEVLSQMYTLLSEYEQVSVADLYQLVNMEPSTTDFKFGWVSLEGSDVRRLREGYALSLPRTEPL
jgi:hypothetical protein